MGDNSNNDAESSAQPAVTEQTITVTKDGPYLVKGSVPLRTKEKVTSELGEPLTWETDPIIETKANYSLCRCGHSENKPFCDGTHAKIGFDGTETAPDNTYAERAEKSPGTHVEMSYDESICVHAGFCGNKQTDLWKMIDKTSDTQVRSQLMSMIEKCPSGAVTYTTDMNLTGTVDSADWTQIEPDLPAEISVIPNGPLWVSDGIPVRRSDGIELEVRNRVTLCRCGASKNKPLCDGTHQSIGFVG